MKNVITTYETALHFVAIIIIYCEMLTGCIITGVPKLFQLQMDIFVVIPSVLVSRCYLLTCF